MNLANPGAAGLPPLTAEQLPDDLATLRRMVLELLASLQERQHDYEALRHRIDLLLRRLYGPRGERFDPNQPLLFAELVPSQDAAAATASTEPAAAAEPRRQCKPHGRRRMPENLPREPRHYELSEAERLCPSCGQTRIDIGVVTSEQLDYRPASLIVIEHIVHRYVCPCCSRQTTQSQGQPPHLGQEAEPVPARSTEFQPPLPPPEPRPTLEQMDNSQEQASSSEQAADQCPPSPAPTPPCRLLNASEVVIVAPKPPMPIPKGLPGPGLLAHLIVSKYTDHLPLHRLERVYQRQGLFLHRSTLCDWLAARAQLLRPLYDLMVSGVLQSQALHTGDTTVKTQELVTHLLSTARFWVYLGDAAHPYNVCSTSRSTTNATGHSSS
ncbi:MAG TPA: transposase [Gemmataceae bacterium]|nr:transposase [Gemmataceae bacterium]